jgi:hypothetical protein
VIVGLRAEQMPLLRSLDNPWRNFLQICRAYGAERLILCLNRAELELLPVGLVVVIPADQGRVVGILE